MSHDADTPAQFNALLQKADRSLVDFHATWCGPCKAIAPYVVSQCQAKGVNLIKVDVDKNGEIAAKYSIQAMPTFKVIDRNGNAVFEKVGGGQANVNACIEKALSG
jgi:thioredoxin 1